MTEEKGFNIFKSLASLDRRAIYVLIFIIVLLINFYPIGLPMSVTSGTQDYYSYVKKLTHDDIILSTWETGFSGYNESKPG